MAKCSECGKEFDPYDTESTLWAVCGIFRPSIMDGLCYSCALSALEEETGVDYEDELESMSDEEIDARAEDIVDAMQFMKRGPFAKLF